MRQPRHRTELWSLPSCSLRIAARAFRGRRVVLSLAGVVGLLAGTFWVLAPPASAADTGTLVTEVPVALGADSVAADNDTNMLYVGSSDGINVIFGSGNTVALTINVPPGAVEPVVAVDPTSDIVYAIGYPSTGPTAYVINGETELVEASIQTTISLPSGLEAGSIAVDPKSDMVYVADDQNASIVVINGHTNTIATTIPLADPTLAPNPVIGGIAVDSATSTVYVTDNGDDQIAVINEATNAVTDRIDLPAGSLPQGLAVDSAAGLVYVADQGTGEISAVNTTTNSVSTLTSGLTQPQGVALGTGVPAILFATGAVNSSMTNLGTTYLIDPSSGAITNQLPRGGSSVATFVDNAYVDGSGSASPLGADLTVMAPDSEASNTMSPVLLQSGNSTFFVGKHVSVQLMASAAPAATFSATGLPDGLTLSASGLLSGTPTTSGDYTVVVTAANGVAPSASETDFAQVEQAQAPIITSTDMATFTEEVAGSFAATASGLPAPTLTESGTLPAGVTFSAGGPGTDGVLSGTPAAGTVGNYPIKITASNSVGTATQAFTLTVTAPPPPPVTYENPSVAWTGTAEVIAATDSSGNLDYWWQAAGTAPWHEQQVAAASGGVTYADPSIAWTGTAEVITAEDSNGGVDYWWQAAGTAPWHQQQVAAGGGAVTYGRPSIAWTGTAEVITATVSSGGVDYWWQAAGTAPWNEQQVAVPLTVVYFNAAIAWTGTAEVITAQDSSGGVDYWWQAAGTAPWHQQQVAAGGGAVTYANPEIAWTGTAEVITAADSSGGVDYWWQAAGTGTWHQQQVAAAVTVGYPNPEIAWNGADEVITATDSTGSLDYWWQAAGTSTWNEEQVAPGGLVNYLFPSIAPTGTATVITATDSAGNLDYWWQAAGTAPWNEQQVAAGG